MKARSGFLLEHTEIGEPFLEPNMPCPERDAIAAADAASVSPVRVDVKLRRDARSKQRIVKLHRLPRVRLVVAARAYTTASCRRSSPANNALGISAWTPLTISTTWVTRKLTPILHRA
jgi:hypothetical protein